MPRNKISGLRSSLYRLAWLLGDVEAVADDPAQVKKWSALL